MKRRKGVQSTSSSMAVAEAVAGDVVVDELVDEGYTAKTST